MKLYRSWQIHSYRRLAAQCFVLGFQLLMSNLLLLGLIVLFEVFIPGFNRFTLVSVAWLVVVVVVIPLAITVHNRHQIQNFHRRLWCAFWTSTGAALPPYAAILLFAMVLESIQSLKWILIGHTGLFVIWLLLMSIAWPIMNHIEPIRLQDGATCPLCGHCVRGAASGICPECGNDFDHTQLGISIAEYDRLVGGTRRDL